MRPIKGIFWDNDGVLVDTERYYFQASAETLAGIGVHLSRDDFSEISLRRGESVLDLAAEKGLGEGGMKRLRDERNERYALLLGENARAIDGVEETLHALHGRVRMAVVTTSRRDHFEIIHRRSGLLKYFDFVLTREDYRLSKPHPEPYLKALDGSGLPAEECLAVEDSERGLRAACAAGLRCLVLPGDLAGDSDFTLAEKILADIRQVPAAVITAGGDFASDRRQD